MKLNLFLSAVLLAGVISASAVTQPAAVPAVSAATNAPSPEAAMKALFGDPVIVKGKGFELKQSDLDRCCLAQRPTPPRKTSSCRRNFPWRS